MGRPYSWVSTTSKFVCLTTISAFFFRRFQIFQCIHQVSVDQSPNPYFGPKFWVFLPRQYVSVGECVGGRSPSIRSPDTGGSGRDIGGGPEAVKKITSQNV